MPRRSAGLLVYRRAGSGVQVLLVHPGGPFWARKDAGAWSIPKGEYAEGEEPLAAARHEFHEETGVRMDAPATPLAPLRQAGGKWVQAYAVEGDLDAAAVRSNICRLEWPRGSGRHLEFPEIDRAQWFGLAEARGKLLASQHPLLDELQQLLR